MKRVHVIDDVDALAGVPADQPERFGLPGTESDPDWFAVTFAERLRPQLPRTVVRSAAEPWNPQPRLIRFACGTNVLAPAHASAEALEVLYLDARLNVILWLVNPAGTA